MSRKIYSAAPKTEIEIQFEDDKSVIIIFNATAIFRLQEICDIDDTIKSESITDTCTKLIYAGAVENNPGFTLEDATRIVSNLDIDTMTSILADFVDSMPRIKNQALSETQKKTMQMFTSSL